MIIIGAMLALLLQAQPGSIEGIITKPGGEPLAGARVALVAVDAFIPQLSATSDEDGRFTLKDVPPGDYNVFAESKRYGSAAYGQRKSGGPGSTLTINPGQRLTEIKISMTAYGVIAGRITRNNGEP